MDVKIGVERHKGVLTGKQAESMKNGWILFRIGNKWFPKTTVAAKNGRHGYALAKR